MPRANPNEDLPIAPDHSRIVAVESLTGLAHSQIAASLARAANIDTQALGLIGLDAGLIAVVLTAHEVFGPHYWAAIPGLVVSIILGGSVLAVTRFDLGPDPEDLYAQLETGVISGERAITKLFVNLVETDKANKGPLRAKIMRLVTAIGVLILTIIYTTFVIVP
jgi:hypothetical protein